MVIQVLIDAIRSACPNLVLNCWYLDDGVIGGTAKEVHKALDILQTLGPELGMDLNLTKNELVKFSDKPDDFPSEFARFNRNFELLGSPIGDADFCTEYISEYTRKRVRHMLSALQSIPDPQVFHFLVRCCSSLCKVVHLLRSVPPSWCQIALVEFDQCLRQEFSRGVGICFDNKAYAQLSLPVNLGGMGLRQAVNHASAAYVASVTRCAQLDGWACEDAPGWNEAMDDLCGRIAVLPASPSQHALSTAVDKSSFDDLLASCDDFDRARLMSVSGQGASSWLSVIPSEALGSVLDSREFTCLLRFWLGMPVYEETCACPWCGAAQDRFGYHALVCKKTGLKVQRHDALREVFLSYCKMGWVTAVREAPNLLPDSSKRPADILLQDAKLLKIPHFSGDRDVCLDFAAIHTQQIKYIKRASVDCGAAAADYETKVKEAKSVEDCNAQDLEFVPMVVEVFGSWGKKAQPVIKFISQAVALHKKMSFEQVDVYLRQRASIVLQRHNARALLRHRNPNTPTVDGPVRC